MDDKYVNDKVYNTVAEKHGIPVNEIKFVMGFVSSTMAKVIREDDPKRSLKLDYLANLYSKDKQREKIESAQEKNNGRITINSRGRVSD
jgi:hypothetical protein